MPRLPYGDRAASDRRALLRGHKPLPLEPHTFSLRCKAHHNLRTAGNAKADREARSNRERVRRKIDQQNRIQAAVFYGAEQVALREQRAQQARERKERIALFKRQSLRVRGGYNPAKDGIKQLIRARMQEAMRRRLAASASRGPQGAWEGSGTLKAPQEGQRTAHRHEGTTSSHEDSWALLEAERAKNRAALAAQESKRSQETKGDQ